MVPVLERLHSRPHLLQERPAPPSMQARSSVRAVIGYREPALGGNHDVVQDMKHISHAPSLMLLLVISTNTPCLRIQSHLRSWLGTSMAARPF